MAWHEHEFEAGLERLQEALGYRFEDPGLLRRALTHRSWANEQNEHVADNERLEFLGDAVLELVVSRRLFHTYEEMREGEMSRARAAIVRAETLGEVANQLGLGAILRLGRGEDATGGRTKVSVLADAMEAMIAALYLDGGMHVADAAVDRLMGALFAVPDELVRRDPKSRLQEILQEQGLPTPSYPLVNEFGPDHSRRFVIQARCGEEVLGEGEGRSKKEAALEAARKALETLEP